MKLCGKDKALRLNDFTVEFFLNNCECVKYDVIKAVKNFRNGRVLKEVNMTNICTIPKEQNMKVGDLRPISLCNITYKLIAKCLAWRLKTYLSELVSKN